MWKLSCFGFSFHGKEWLQERIDQSAWFGYFLMFLLVPVFSIGMLALVGLILAIPFSLLL